MQLSRVAFILGSLQQASLANGENLLRGNRNIQNETTSNNIFASTKTQGGRCKALIQVSDNGDSPDSLSPVCMLDDGTIVPIVGRGSTFWEEKMESGEFSSGETQVTGCEFVQSFEEGGPAEECFIPEGHSARFLSNVVDTDDQEEHERRNLAKVNGKRKILVVRVIANNRATTAGESALARDVFDDSVNVATQYKACSQGKLNFVKANNRAIRGANKGRGETSIRNGVTTVRVNMSTGKGDGAMVNAITAALKQNFGVSSPARLANHVMYCLPRGTMNGIAYAYVNSWMSVYSDQWCGSLSGQMHEIGHNLNLGHANEKGSYKDQTGMMGYAYSSNNGPIMCFNAAQSWQLGWYSEKAVTLQKNKKKNHVGVLGGIADYSDTNNVVLVKLNTGKSTDYYVNFNRRAGINSGTVEAGNQVTVVKASGEGRGYSESELVAKLSAGNTYTIRNFDGKRTTATVQVHSIGATADVSICIGPCPPIPSSSPSLGPSQSPTKSSTPSSSPSLTPSLSPAPSHSLAPSQSPTKSATPSSSPSMAPSQSPSKSSTPSWSPSLEPSQTPSESLTPSSSPTQECLDSSTWRTTVRKRKRRSKKGCSWVKGKKQRCSKVGTGKVAARDACPVACGNCPA